MPNSHTGRHTSRDERPSQSAAVAPRRSGNVHSADDWDELLLPEIERQQAQRQRVAFRADAAFAKPEIYEALETRGVSMRSASRPTRPWS